MIFDPLSQTPSAYLAGLCEDGRTPGDRELALAQVIALAHIADSLRHIANGVIIRGAIVEDGPCQ